MKESLDSISNAGHGERGSARLKFIITLAVVAVIAYMGFQYVPVAYHAYTFKDAMSKTVDTAANSAVPIDQKAQWAADQIKASGKKDYGVPDNAKYTPTFENGQVTVRVQFTQPINLLPGLTYQYNFDYTARSSTFLNP
jgi:hypothetical protein